MNDLRVDVENYTEQIVTLLWPDAAVDAEGGAAGMLALPSVRRARLLVPARQRKVASSAVQRYSVHGDAKARLSSAALSIGLRSGLLQPLIRRRSWLPGGTAEQGSITAHLRTIVSLDCEVAVYVGLPRGNRKPVLLVLEPNGTLSAVAKLGVTALSGRLIRNESEALTTLNAAPLKHVTVPQVLFAGEWAGAPLLVQSALPEIGPAPGDTARRREAAAVEISRINGVETHRVATSPVLDELEQRVAALPEGSERDLAGRTLYRLRDAGDVEFPVGSWHGDWTPWNHAAASTGGMLVWDWERFSAGVPLGYDALHFSGQVGAGLHGGPQGALAVTRSELNALLDPFGVAAEARQTVFALYLLEILVRYTEDGQARMAIGRSWVDALAGCLEGFLADLARPSSQQRKAS
ncbi:MAG TPA: hypothetical protein VHX15_04505 [Frankiaceae bacterium]|nr:hypothetical protein [Frankiaceae bacterium]